MVWKNIADRIRQPIGAVIFLIAVLFFPMFPAAAAAQGYMAGAFLTGLGAEPMLGSRNAPVWIVEFSDFQCGFCRIFWQDTLPKLKQSYIEKGTVRFTYRHFAILGKPSEHAALASECAAEQDQFWPYHDKLFEKQREALYTVANLKEFARELGLDSGRFEPCLDSGKYREKVERETATAAYLGGRGTPVFFVNQRLLPGAQPYPLFQKIIHEELVAARGKK